MRLLDALLPDFRKARELLAIAWPVVLGMSTHTVFLAVNTAFLGRVSPEAQGVAALGDVTFLVVFLTLGGLGVGTQVLSARRLGEGRPEKAGAVLDNALVLAFGLGSTASLLAVAFAPQLSAALFPNRELRELGEPFLKVRFLGLLPSLLASSFRGFFVGIARTRHFLIAAFIRMALNVILDYALIFGHFGLPRMGLLGAAWAGNIAFVAAALYFVPVLLTARYRGTFRAFRFSGLSLDVVKRLVRLSVPAGSRQFVGLGSYIGFFRIIAEMGTVDLAAANVTRSVFNIFFMPVLGVGFAVSSLVSRNLGAGRPDRSESHTFSALHIAMWCTAVVFASSFAFAHLIARAFTDDPAVAWVAGETFRYGGFFLIVMPLGMVFAAALEGAGRIWFILAVETFGCAVYFACAWLFGIAWNGGLVAAYSAETVYWLLVGLLLGIRFFGRSWHRSKV